jgi:acyl carrier protein
MKEKIIDIISDVLKIKKSNISLKTTMNKVEHWDSLKQMQIIIAIEDEFNIKFSEDNLSEANSVKKLIEATKKLKN